MIFDLIITKHLIQCYFFSRPTEFQDAMDLSVQKSSTPTISPIRHGRKAAIMRKFLNEETKRIIEENDRRKLLVSPNSKSVTLPDLSCCFSDSSASDDVIIIEDSNDAEEFNIEKSERREEEIYQRSVAEKNAEVSSVKKSDESPIKTKLKDYKCTLCKFTTTEKRSLKTHVLLHKIEKHEITNDRHTHACEHKELPCLLCNLPRITLKIDIKPNPLISNSLECPVCFRKILKRSGMNKHLQAHIDHHKRQSAVLGKKEKNFNQKNQRILQMATNGKKFPFECSKCKLPFAEEYDKRAHEELCRRRQYKHLWNFSDVKITERKNANSQDLKVKNTIELKTHEEIEVKVEIVDAKRDEKMVDVNMECQKDPVEAPWRPWA